LVFVFSELRKGKKNNTVTYPRALGQKLTIYIFLLSPPNPSFQSEKRPKPAYSEPLLATSQVLHWEYDAMYRMYTADLLLIIIIEKNGTFGRVEAILHGRIREN
jgi:hypothetical protein